MRKYGYLIFDVLAVIAALVLALYLRNGTALIEEGRPDDLPILLALSVVVPLLVLPLMRTHKRIWRYTSSADLSAVMIAAAICVLLINGGLFLFNRLEIVPRSVPPMHWALIVFSMGGSRLVARWLFGAPRNHSAKRQVQHVLIVGANHAAELYIEFAKKIIPGQVSIEGILDENYALTGRSFHQYSVLGVPTQLEDILQELHVHGIVINKLILVQPLDQLSLSSQQAMLELEQKAVLELVHFDRQIGLYNCSETLEESAPKETIPTRTYAMRPRRMYPAFKRLVDVLGSALLLAVFAPFLLLAALLVALDVGLPIFFWQKRPGLHGKSFRLYKFRTMRSAGRGYDEDRLAHKSGDRERTSRIGHWLRRLRLDELPQLFHILRGTMSFIGPRPLLPDDQPESGEQRLLVRPGITGWAQVNGGDALSPEQKLVLDIWYIQNMSLALDLRILLRTCMVLFHEDTAQLDAVKAAQSEIKLQNMSG